MGVDMKFIIATVWDAKKVTIGYLLQSRRHRHDWFVNDADDEPYRYTSDWFESQNKGRTIYVLTNPIETGVIK